MLIETPYKETDVVTLKLSNGEEVIARLELDDKDSFVITKPLVAMMTEKGIALMPYLYTVDHETRLIIKSSQVICIVKTVKEVADHYLQSTSNLTVGI